MRIIAIIMLFIATTCLADELQIPTSCFPKKLQAKFHEKGYKLDLSANDREEDSWGFIVSKGTEYSIFTYNPLTKEDLENVLKVLGEK